MGGLLNLTILAVLVALLTAPLYRQVTLMGVLRKPISSSLTEGQTVFKIEDTMQCEDLHHHLPTNKLFTACEDSTLPRFGWFPPMTAFKQPSHAQGSIHVIDPVTMQSTRLTFEDGFSGPFITHGIDVLEDPARPDAVYIFAVNHAPHPAYQPGSNWEGPKARSQIELFHHVLETPTVKHVRSIRHPLIKTPNDIYAESPSSFYVTNDHGHRDGLRRLAEDAIPVARWSSTIHVRLDNMLQAPSDPETGINATVALSGLYNNNGLGHGRTADEIMIGSAMGGTLYRAQRSRDQDGNTGTSLSIVEEIRLDSAIDNPTYFTDFHRTTASDDASGFVLAGLRRPIDMLKNQADPSAKDGTMVWYIRPNATASEGVDNSKNGKWETRLLFEDDGTHIRTGSAAVLVQKPGEAKKAWLFVTGFLSENIIALQVDL